MLTFAVQAPNVVKEYTFSSGAEGWYVLGGGTLSSGGGAIEASTEGKSWVSPAVNIYDSIKAGGEGTYVINATVTVFASSGFDASAGMLIRTTHETSFSKEKDGNFFGDIGVKTHFKPGTLTYISGSVKVMESDIQAAADEFVLCFDKFNDSASHTFRIENVTICKLNTQNITNGDFSYYEIGWRNWGGDGNFVIQQEEDSILGVISNALYLKASTYGSIATNIDQILETYGSTRYVLSFKMRVDGEAYENMNSIDFYLTKRFSDYHYHVNYASKEKIEEGEWTTFTYYINMGAKFSDGKTLYDKLSPYENEVFLRYQYRTVDGVTLDDDQSYCITDVEFRVQYGVSNLRFQHSDLAVYEGWTGQLMPLVNVDQTIAYDSLEWNTSDSNVVSITDNYKLVANNKGTAIITAKLKGDNTVYARCIINVSEYKEAVILLHGRSDNSTYVFGASNAIGIGNDKDHDDNDNYNSSIYAVTANNKSYTNVEDQLIQDNNGIKSIFNGYYEGGSVKDYDGEEYDGNLAEYLINEKGYEANINLFIFNYPNEDAVVHNAIKFRVFIDNLMTYVRNNESEKMRRSFYPNSTSDPNSFKFSLVGHSMGGLVSRYYIENCTNIEHYHNNSHNGSACQYNDNHVSKLITIDTPHWGSLLADASETSGALHKLCDHDLELTSKMYGGISSVQYSCPITLPFLNCGAVNYRFTEQLNYSRNRQTNYYAIAGISDDVNLNDKNNHYGEISTNLNSYLELEEEFLNKFNMVISSRTASDNTVSLCSQIGWTNDLNVLIPQKQINFYKIFVNIDANGGNNISDHFHGKMPHREPVMAKVSEFLGE